MDYVTQKSKLKMEATGIECLIENVKTFMILLYYCRQAKSRQYCVCFLYLDENLTLTG